MHRIIRVLAAALVAGSFAAGAGHAGDVLFYYGHGGIDEGHADFSAIIAAEGGSVDFSSAATLPSLAGYRLVLISVPGHFDDTAFFSAAEKFALNAFLADANHKVVLIGEWDGFYGPGQDVLIDLAAAIGGGTGIAFIPGVYDSGCYAYGCGGALGVSPLVSGLGHLCKAATAIWDPGTGGSVAFPVEAPDDPWVVDNGTDVPCIVGIGDSNTLSDGCGHLADADTEEFARRLYTIRCSGEPVQAESATWGRVKSTYR
jgi:hypothetical protein